MKNMAAKYPKDTESTGFCVVLLGPRSQGKSIIVRDILYHHQHIPTFSIISGTEDVNKFYSYMIPRLFINYEYNTLIIENLLKRQRAIVNQHSQEKKDFGSTKTDPRAVCVLDDCLYDAKTWSNDKLMRFIFTNGRHLRVMLIITLQYPIGIPPMMRSNIDYTFILRENIISNRKKIYDNYAGMFETFDAFNQIMTQCTQNYECLVIDNTTKSNNLNEMVFWYKAQIHPEFKLCDKKYWEMSKNYVDEQGLPYDHNKLKKKSSSIIEVKKLY